VEEGLAASGAVGDAAYLFPFVVTGTRVFLAAGDPLAVERWLAAVDGPLRARAIPGTQLSLDHARGLWLTSEGSTGQARAALETAIAGWARLGRIWEGTWAQVDLARCHLRANQRMDAARAARVAREAGLSLGSAPLVAAAEDVLRASGRGAAGTEPWGPLTTREFEVARLVADGRTNAEIAHELDVAPKTASAHLEHLLAKLGVGRRAEIAAWVTLRPVLHSRPHGEDREE
jgi:DNA-binding CsgD family transcriptional regulator